MTVQVFSVPVFFIVFRETLETAIIVSVLLAFLKQTIRGPDRTIYKRLVKEVWIGAGLGLIICLIIGAGIIGSFYGYGRNAWSGAEDYWEGTFAILASLIITVMGAALLRVSKMQEKWQAKLEVAMRPKVATVVVQPKRGFKRWCERYAMFLLPFITVLREGLEAIIFVAGVSFQAPASSFPLPVIVGLLAGVTAGYLIYKGGATSKLQLFLVISTCFLYLVAAGLFSKGVWNFEMAAWSKKIGGDAAETGSGPGSYDIDNSVWHVNCCNPELNGGGGWGIFNAILGWTNSATYGSVISYNVYWLAVIVGFIVMRHCEVNGHRLLLPGMRAHARAVANKPAHDVSSSEHGSTVYGPAGKGAVEEGGEEKKGVTAEVRSRSVQEEVAHKA